MSVDSAIEVIDLTLETTTVLNTVDLTQESPRDTHSSSATVLFIVTTSNPTHTSVASSVSTAIDFPPLFLSCDVPPECCPLCRRYLGDQMPVPPPAL